MYEADNGIELKHINQQQKKKRTEILKAQLKWLIKCNFVYSHFTLRRVPWRKKNPDSLL